MSKAAAARARKEWLENLKEGDEVGFKSRFYGYLSLHLGTFYRGWVEGTLDSVLVKCTDGGIRTVPRTRLHPADDIRALSATLRKQAKEERAQRRAKEAEEAAIKAELQRKVMEMFDAGADYVICETPPREQDERSNAVPSNGWRVIPSKDLVDQAWPYGDFVPVPVKRVQQLPPATEELDPDGGE